MTRVGPTLRSIQIENFRSISGDIELPLDSPVVLIHGQNGAGKTSVLSAIELGLTKGVPSLASLDDGYLRHLVHKGASQSRIIVAAEGLTDSSSAEILIKGSQVTGKGLLGPDQSRFYSERCYLAQATLGRLLEIYQLADARQSDSPLTKFVKDLLGLDQLDNLIDGLYDAGDVRRLRSKAPRFWEIRERIPKLKKEIASFEKEAEEIATKIVQVEAQLNDGVRKIVGSDEIPVDPNQLRIFLNESLEKLDLSSVARTRLDISVLRRQWEQGRAPQESQQLAYQEERSQAADSLLEDWRKTFGRRLEEEFFKLEKFFSALPSPSTAQLEEARSLAQDLIGEEWKRCEVLLNQNEKDEKVAETLDQDIKRAKARVAVIEKMISKSTASAGELAQALVGIIPHIDSDQCPVCDRDFKEVSHSKLRMHVSSNIVSLTESAAKLGELIQERTTAIATITKSERERGAIVSRLLESKERDQLKTRRARLEESNRAITELAPATKEGEILIAAALKENRQLNAMRARANLANTVRDALNQQCSALQIPPIGDKETIESAFGRIEGHVVNLEEELTRRQTALRQAISDKQALDESEERKVAVQGEMASLKVRHDCLVSAKGEADERINQARELSKRARDARASVVRRVFNDSLNSLWRDLFVRLVPDEPFIPAFALPKSEARPVEAILETIYRSGGKGGNPQAMLSAGNLNTAALTLFMALHLSVKPVLPWLVVDDPVQSMDEVHIAQFAALLRTLSKQLGRQVIIAVHERALFDYLALELSPAFKGDRLITIELGRAPDGATTVNYEPIVWQPDKAFAA